MTNPTPHGQVPASSAVLKAIRAANMQLVRTGDDEFMLVTYKNAKAQCDGGKCGIGGYCDDCPTAQADSQPALDRDRIREIFMAHGFTVKEGQTDLKQYVYDAADALLRTARAQADSVCYDYAKQIAESMWATHYKADAPHWESCDSLMGVLSQISNMMCGLSRAPADSVTAPAGGAEEVDKALNDYAQAFMARAMGWTRENGDAMPDARTKLYSAISSYARGLFTTSPRAPADSQPAAGAPVGGAAILKEILQPAQAAESVPAVSDLPPLPDPDLRDVGTKPQDVKDFLNGYATEYARLALASRAPVNSVLEDAARLTTEQEYAIRQGHEIAASEAYFGARSKLDTNRNHNIFTAGFERGWDAARKQGANHD